MADLIGVALDNDELVGEDLEPCTGVTIRPERSHPRRGDTPSPKWFHPNLIASGTPRRTGLAWPTHAVNQRSTMVFDVPSQVVDDLGATERRAWDDSLTTGRSAAGCSKPGSHDEPLVQQPDIDTSFLGGPSISFAENAVVVATTAAATSQPIGQTAVARARSHTVFLQRHALACAVRAYAVPRCPLAECSAEPLSAVKGGGGVQDSSVTRLRATALLPAVFTLDNSRRASFAVEPG